VEIPVNPKGSKAASTVESNYTVEEVTKTCCSQVILSSTNTEFPTNIALTQGSFKLI
jgi:hypothetical protein